MDHETELARNVAAFAPCPRVRGENIPIRTKPAPPDSEKLSFLSLMAVASPATKSFTLGSGWYCRPRCSNPAASRSCCRAKSRAPGPNRFRKEMWGGLGHAQQNSPRQTPAHQTHCQIIEIVWFTSAPRTPFNHPSSVCKRFGGGNSGFPRGYVAFLLHSCSPS